MKPSQKPVIATGILSYPSTRRVLTSHEKQILRNAENIRGRRSSQGRTGQALEEIRTYVIHSNHSAKRKIANLEADLAKPQSVLVKEALKKAITRLKKRGY